ncbi:MAG: response regulator [Candidatus Competibacteraceae bacterium]|nr:response regulator [Candidatus Competibacteraceae bacterium]
MNIEKALVVDDSKVAHLTLRKLLMERNIEVDWVGSGEEAVSYMKKQRPDIIFMDVMMPGMDGFETTHAITNDAEIGTPPPIIMCSANATDEDKENARQSGASSFLSKPYTPAQMDQILNSVREFPTQRPGAPALALAEEEPLTIVSSGEPTPAAEPASGPAMAPAEPTAAPEPIEVPAELAGAIPDLTRIAEQAGRAAAEQVARQIAAEVARTTAEQSTRALSEEMRKVARTALQSAQETAKKVATDTAWNTATEAGQVSAAKAAKAIAEQTARAVGEEVAQQSAMRSLATVREDLTQAPGTTGAAAVQSALAQFAEGDGLKQQIAAVARETVLAKAEFRAREIAIEASQETIHPVLESSKRIGLAITLSVVALLVGAAAIALKFI